MNGLDWMIARHKRAGLVRTWAPWARHGYCNGVGYHLKPEQTMKRTVERYRYGVWAGRPNGLKRDGERCIVAVRGGGLWGAADEHQCQCTALHGPGKQYCATHARMLADHISLPVGRLMLVTQRRDTVRDAWVTVSVTEKPVTR